MVAVLQLFYQATNELENFMLKAATQELVDALVGADSGPATEDALFGLFAEYMVQNYSAELQIYRSTTHSAMGLHCLACMSVAYGACMRFAEAFPGCSACICPYEMLWGCMFGMHGGCVL